MSRWTHADATWLIVGMIGIVLALGGLAAAATAFATAEAVPTGAWLAMWVGAAFFSGLVVKTWWIEQRVTKYQQLLNNRANAIRDEVAQGENPVRPYFVYLRPFDVDGAFVEAPRKDADQQYVEEYG